MRDAYYEPPQYDIVNTNKEIASKIAQVVSRKIAVGELGVQNDYAKEHNFKPNWWKLCGA